jgi:two-component system, cell cycle response regulator
MKESSMDKRKILLIEDSPAQALFSKTILEEAGFQVITAATGEFQVDRIDEDPPQIILVNGSLQDSSTRRMVKALRKKAQNYIPILLMTGNLQDLQDSDGTGADESMQASYQQREFLGRVNRLASVKEMIDKLVMKISSEEESYQILKQIALYDLLTNIYNRDYFIELLEREFSMAQRYQTPMACIIGDLDNFRDFNIAYGAGSGDVVLKGIAKLLKENIRQGDIVARFGDEEFVLLLPMTNASAARELGERLRQKIENTVFDGPDGKLNITISFGIGGMPTQKVKTAADLLELAHRAVYRAKLFGRNRVEILLGTTQDLSSKRW